MANHTTAGAAPSPGSARSLRAGAHHDSATLPAPGPSCAAILIHLITAQLGHQPQVLRRLVVAILVGGNLQVPDGKVIGATFTNVPLCTSATQTGCAIAFSSFASQPPAEAESGLKEPVHTPWVTYPGLYSATCEQGGGATWLQVTSLAGTSHTRPVVTDAVLPGIIDTGPAWGYHGYEFNLTPGNLLNDVAGEEAAWQSSH
jgi:Protein of unknown function (DUF3089)